MIGITVASTLFQNLLRLQLRKKLGSAKDVEEIVKKTWNTFGAIQHLPQEQRLLVIHSYFDALRGVFGLLLGIGIAGSTMMLFMKEHSLNRK